MNVQGLSFPLRTGETCALQNETLSVGERQIPLRDIVSAGLVADLSVAVPPGMPPTPGVSLRLGDGGTQAFTPVEQLDCWRLLQALAAARPALAAPLPPPPGSTPGYMGRPVYGYGYGPGYPLPGYFPPYGAFGPSENEKTLAGVCHLSVFFAPVILPLVIWLVMRRTQPFASQQAKQAFGFHVSFAALGFILGIALQAYVITTTFSAASVASPTNPGTVDLSFLPGLFAFYGLLIALGLINMIFSVIAAIQAFQGKPYHYPLLGWLAR